MERPPERLPLLRGLRRPDRPLNGRTAGLSGPRIGTTPIIRDVERATGCECARRSDGPGRTPNVSRADAGATGRGTRLLFGGPNAPTNPNQPAGTATGA